MFKSTAYQYPYAALDVYLTIYRPMIKLFVSGGYLIHVTAELQHGDQEPADMTGSGFTLRGGFDFDLLRLMNVGIGYEIMMFFIGDDISDQYQGFYLRVGLKYN